MKRVELFNDHFQNYKIRNKDSGFCAMRDLFYGVEKTEKPCEDWEYDNGDDC